MLCPYCGATLVYRVPDGNDNPYLDESYFECCGCHATFGIALTEDECPKCGKGFAQADTYCLQCGHIRNDYDKKGGY